MYYCDIILILIQILHIMNQEKTVKAITGWLALLMILAILGIGLYFLISTQNPAFAFVMAATAFCIKGFLIVNPNESSVLVFFGKYVGTIKANGFFWVNPFYTKRKISLRARNLDSQHIKVNDKLGNPIMIGVVLVWRVENTYKAAFEVNDFQNFVTIQSESAVRRLAGSYPYDKFDDEDADISLRDGGDEVDQVLENELSTRLEIAGIHVIEARISHLAYAQEIAGAMLQRQQATAIVAARKQIVEGAVGMVEMALQELSDKSIIELDDEKKAAMVSNLMVVLCSDKAASPVINTGTLHQ